MYIYWLITAFYDFSQDLVQFVLPTAQFHLRRPANKCRVYNIWNSKKAQSQGGCPNQIHSDQTIVRIVRWEAEPCERWPKALKTKLTQGGHQAQVHSDQMVLVMAMQEPGPH
jgi:hypothetical protein